MKLNHHDGQIAATQYGKDGKKGKPKWLDCKNVVVKKNDRPPDTSNDGARRGSICHLIFEVLGEPRHRKHYDEIMQKHDIFSVPCVERLVMKHARREGVDDEENIQMIKEMTFNGLSYDFFGYDLDDPTEELSEQDFDIVKNDGDIAYRIRGFIDKLFLYKKQKFALIRDFKTSKEVFKGKDAEDNMQDLMYSLASQHLFPAYKNKQSEFASPFCNILPGPFTVKGESGIFNAPSMSSTVLSFASTYLIYPMINNNQTNNRPSFIKTIGAVLTAGIMWGSGNVIIRSLLIEGLNEIFLVTARVSIIGTLLFFYYVIFNKEKFNKQLLKEASFTGLASIFFVSWAFIFSLQ